MSEKTSKIEPMEELVDFTAPLDPTGERQEIILGVNGETIRVKRGSSVKIKRKFLEVWEHAGEQAMTARATMEKAQEGGKAPLLAM